VIGAGSLRQTAYSRLHALSLTTRLVAVVVLMVLAAYLVTTTLTTMLLRGYLTERIDTELRQYIAPLGQVAYSNLPETGIVQTTLVPPNNYFVLLTPRATGSSTYTLVTPTTGDDRPALRRVDWDDPRLGDGPFTVTSPGGHDWRVLADRVPTGEGTVAIALPLAPVDNTVKQLWVLTSFIGAATLAAVAVLGWVAVRRAFRPLRRIEDTAAAIAAGDLTRRIPRPGADDEVASLSESLNAMLAHIEQAFSVREASEARMQQFVADASHELRTPLATVRGYAELYRVGGVRDPDDVAGAMSRIEGEATRMTRLVEDLLLLTRWDTAPRMADEPVDLTVLVGDVVQDSRVRNPEHHVRMVPLEGGTGSPVTCGDDGALRQVLTNLVANAVAHTPVGTDVEVALGVQQARCVVEVRDHGEGIDPAVAERVFERFFRVDPSRSRERGGTGLGLAIVATIVARHGGTVRHVPTPGGGATFRVELPLKTRDQARSAVTAPTA
jgi:two-component system, OmpR family, sensor kinase